MADITPVTDKTTAGWCPRNSFRMDAPVGAPTAQAIKRVHGHRLVTGYFADIDSGTNEDWCDPRGVMASAWQAVGTADKVTAVVGTQTSIRMGAAANNLKGWVHALVRGTQDFTDTTDEPPATKGTAGYVRPGSIFLNHRSATPDTLTQARVDSVSGMRFQVYHMQLSGATPDRWLATSSRLCPGIVAVAWQSSAASAAGRVAATLDVAGDVIFTSDGNSGMGWLWTWRKA